MSWRDSLIRISTYEVETLQKRLAEVVDRRAEAEMRLVILEAEGESEIAHAEADAQAGWYRAGFLQALRGRKTALRGEIGALDAEEAGARDALAEAFEALKRFEQVAENARVVELKAEARRETVAMDELGLRRESPVSRRAPRLSRRGLIAGAAAAGLAACSPRARSQDEPIGPLPPLKADARFPVGCAVTTAHLADPAYASLLARQFDQVTPEWEMKMEYILQDDGSLRFDAPDAIAAFAKANGMSLFAHTLVWYAQSPAAFQRLDGQRDAFAKAYGDYIAGVAGRYRDAAGWDVVNEAVEEDGRGLRACLWSKNLGQIDYMRRAFDAAHAAAPHAVLLLNDYNLESLPAKRATFMRLAETLLKTGAPLTGLGTQSHLAADLAPGAITTSITDLASLGLPIHVSELDISLNRAQGALVSRQEWRERQKRLAGEIGEAFARLPAAHRHAFTIWGLRDVDSWLRGPKENPDPPWDEPLFFDDAGRPKPMLANLERGLSV